MPDIPDWMRAIGTPVTLEVISCAKCEDAHKIRQWLTDKMPHLTFYVVGVSIARTWLVLAIDSIDRAGELDDAHDSSRD